MAGTVGVNFSIGAALSRTVASAFGTVQSRVKGLRSDLRGLETQSKAAARLSAAQSRLETARARYAAQSTPQMRAALRTAVREFGNAHRAAKEYGISVDNAGRAQERLAQRIQRTQAALARQQRLQANQAKRGELQGQMLGTVGAALAVAAPVKMAIDYESSFADLKKVADFASPEQEKQVQQDIFAAAQRTGISATGMTAIAASAAESGVANDAQGNLDPAKLKQFLNDAAEMAVAYGISAEEAGERLATFQGRMGLNAGQTKAMGDAMNYLASKTTATAAKTSQVVSRVGAVGVTAGLSAKSIVGLAGAFVSTSESPEVAATAMKSFLLAMAQGDAMSKTQKEAFAKIGIRNVKALAEGMKKGGPEAENTIMTVFEAMRKLPEAEQAGIAKDIFGLESFASIAPLVNDPAKLAKAFSLANSKEAVGSQLREFETRSKTTAGALDRLKVSTGVLGITVGSVLLPPLATAANTAVAVIKPITALAERFPTVTKAVMLTGIALVGLKVGALAGMYAATMLSDGWTIARGALIFFRPSVLMTNAALLRQKAVALYTALSAKVHAAGSRIAAAKANLTRFLREEGAFRGQGAVFDHISLPWQQWRRRAIQGKSMEYSLLEVLDDVAWELDDSIKPDGLQCAIANTAIYALTAGRTMKLENDAWRVVVEKVACFIHDGFDFNGDQWLGNWTCKGMYEGDIIDALPDDMRDAVELATDATEFNIYGPMLWNEHFRHFREATGYGCDFRTFCKPTLVSTEEFSYDI